MKKGGESTFDHEKEISELLGRIDQEGVLRRTRKRAMLADVEAEIVRVEADLVALRRMLIQYGDPSAELEDTTLGERTADTLRQLIRLRDYRAEIHLLPNDPSENEGGQDG